MTLDAKTPKPHQFPSGPPSGEPPPAKPLRNESPGNESPRNEPRPPSDGPPPVAVSEHILTWWFGLIALGGVGFGVVAERRPFGQGVLAHPLVVFAAAIAVVLVSLRLAHARPLTEIISERFLIAGGIIAVVCFLIGNWFGINLNRMP
jgi:hypothetical protein